MYIDLIFDAKGHTVYRLYFQAREFSPRRAIAQVSNQACVTKDCIQARSSYMEEICSMAIWKLPIPLVANVILTTSQLKRSTVVFSQL